MEGEEAKEDKLEENVNFFETLVTNIKTYKSKNLADCWYLDSCATKCM